MDVLSSRGVPVRALVRDVSKATSGSGLLAGVGSTTEVCVWGGV